MLQLLLKLISSSIYSLFLVLNHANFLIPPSLLQELLVTRALRTLMPWNGEKERQVQEFKKVVLICLIDNRNASVDQWGGRKQLTNSRNIFEIRKTSILLINYRILIVQVYRHMMFFVVFENTSLEVARFWLCRPYLATLFAWPARRDHQVQLF